MLRRPPGPQGIRVAIFVGSATLGAEPSDAVLRAPSPRDRRSTAVLSRLTRVSSVRELVDACTQGLGRDEKTVPFAEIILREPRVLEIRVEATSGPGIVVRVA